jgi:hypothetical protein
MYLLIFDTGNQATAIKAKKEKSVTYLTQFMQARLRRAVAGRFAKWKLQIVDNQVRMTVVWSRTHER